MLIDFGNLPDFAMKYKEDLKKEFKADATKLVTWFRELREVRNKLQHFDFSLTPDLAEKAFLTMIQIQEAIDEKETVETLRALRTGISPVVSSSTATAVAKGDVISPGTSPSVIAKEVAPTVTSSNKSIDSELPPWFGVVSQLLDIRKGRLDKSVFAANLMEVSLGNGREVYSNASLFFEKTYPTLALKSLIKRVIDGLFGGEWGARW